MRGGVCVCGGGGGGGGGGRGFPGNDLRSGSGNDASSVSGSVLSQPLSGRHGT